MKNRLIGGVIVGIITLAALFAGGAVTAIILLLCSLVGVHEILKVYDLHKSPFAILDYVVTIALYVLLYFEKAQFVMPMLVLFVLLTLAIYVIQFPKYKDADMMRGVFAFLYASILLSFVLRIRSMEAGLALSFFVLISSWINDIFAYFVGSAIGKHKFSPKVSPNKSVEGFIGGVLGAGLIGFAYGTVFAKYMPLPGVYCAIIAALGAIPAVIGDLAASAIKRDNQIKDYSDLIPGHGGMLDRIDSILFTAPIIYYLVELFNVL